MIESDFRFTLPGFYSNKDELAFLLDLMESHPEWKSGDYTISSIYGAVAFMVWNGGRCLFGQIPPLEEIARVVAAYNERGIAINLTATNKMVGQEHLNDWYCNELLEICYRKGNGVIISSEPLAQYVRKHYPDYKLIGSVTMNNHDPAFLKKKLEQLDMIVIPSELNMDEQFWASIAREDRGRIEVLVNEWCPYYCAKRGEHFDDMSYAQMIYYNDAGREGYKGCPKLESKRLMIKSPMLNSSEQIDYLRSLGVKHFKLQGRCLPDFEYFKNVVPFLFKEEHQAAILQRFVRYNFI